MPRLRILKDKKCPTCKKIFRPKSSLSKYCSYDCSTQNRTKKGEYKKCKICNKKFYIMPTFIKTAKYCSIDCQHKGLLQKNSRKKLKCKNCKKDYWQYNSYLQIRTSSYCSKKCQDIFRRKNYIKNKKKKKTKNSVYKKMLWLIFSRYIRIRDGGICISCGKKDDWKKMDAGHYIPKTAGLALYFDEQNVNCQCTYCNRWMHGNLSKYAIALRKKYGENILEKLDAKRKTIAKISNYEYEQLINHYKDKLYNHNENSRQT